MTSPTSFSTSFSTDRPILNRSVALLLLIGWFLVLRSDGVATARLAFGDPPPPVTRSWDDPSAQPSTVKVDAQPIQWVLNWLEPGTLSVHSVPDGGLVESVELSVSDGRCDAALTRSLDPGVYCVRYMPSASNRKWSQLLTWESSAISDNSEGEAVKSSSWPLIVLPKSRDNETIDASSVGPNGKKTLLIHWSQSESTGWSRHVRCDQAESKSTASSILTRIDMPWKKGESNAPWIAESVAWSSVLAENDRRLQRLRTLGADGIVLTTACSKQDSSGDSPDRLIQRTIESQADAIGLTVWRSVCESQNTIADEPPPHILQNVVTDNPPTDPFGVPEMDRSMKIESGNRPPKRVADFRRGPITTLQGRYPPRLNAAENADFVWFGIEQFTRSSESDPTFDGVETITLLPFPLPEPLRDPDNGFAAKAWLADWSRWMIHYHGNPGRDSERSVGLIVDERLFDADYATSSTSISEAITVWLNAWTDDSRWLAVSNATSSDTTTLQSSDSVTASSQSSSKPSGGDRSSATERARNEPLKSANGLVHVRQIHRNGGTTLICFNEAPWAMRVTLPLANLVQWNSVAVGPLASLPVTRPAVSMLGSTVVIAADSFVVCHTPQELSRTLNFGHRIDGGAESVNELTQNVTTIVEHLGLLGELASMTRDPAKFSDPSSRGGTEVAASQSDRPSIWSPQRWGFSYAVTSTNSSTGPSTGTPASLAATGQSDAHEPVATSTMAIDRVGSSPALSSQQPLSELNGSPRLVDASLNSTPAFNEASCRTLIVNGDFEMRHDVGIIGWMHSQHPDGAVELDNRVAYSGKTSMRLRGKDERGSSAWLISREISPPVAGRIGVSMALRGQPPRDTDATVSGKNASTPRITERSESHPTEPDSVVRIAIEGERDGQPIRYTSRVEFTNNGTWQSGRVRLECPDMDPVRDTNLRLTIDNLSTSSIWIDDVVVTDYFATRSERAELQTLAYLAVTGLQHSDLAPTAKLLQNFWAGELLRIARVPPTQNNQKNRRSNDTKSILPQPMWRESADTVMAAKSEVTRNQSTSQTPYKSTNGVVIPASPPPEPTATEPPTSLSRRIRGWLPSPLRF